MSAVHWKRWRFATGMLFGLSVGLAVALGVWLGKSGGTASLSPLEEIRLKASATHGEENLVIATGLVDGESEALFVLDKVTGDLHTFVMNTRGAPKFVARFSTNVVAALPPDKEKKPNYLMVSGTWDPRAAANSRPASSVLYVADANSGLFAAYTFPWGARGNITGPIEAPMILLDQGKARNLEAIRQ